MHRFGPVLVALGLLLPVAASAEDIAGPADIAPAGAVFPCQRAGLTEAFWSCLAAAGVPPGGLDFAHRLAADESLGGPGLLVGFTELGAVDLGVVLFPFLANTNQQTLLINGTAGIVQPLALEPMQPDDPQTRAFLTEYPQAFPSLRLDVAGYRAEGSQQRFVLTDPVTDGCRACAVVAAAVIALVFEDGTLTAVEPLGWVPPDMAADEPRAMALRRGDRQALQVALSLRGYAPGPMDGVDGPQTAEALHRFLADHCLPETERLSNAALALLTLPEPYLDPPGCRVAPRPRG
jgi:Putative peptidoglycan binding domain.